MKVQESIITIPGYGEKQYDPAENLVHQFNRALELGVSDPAVRELIDMLAEQIVQVRLRQDNIVGWGSIATPTKGRSDVFRVAPQEPTV